MYRRLLGMLKHCQRLWDYLVMWFVYGSVSGDTVTVTDNPDTPGSVDFEIPEEGGQLNGSTIVAKDAVDNTTDLSVRGEAKVVHIEDNHYDIEI